MVRSISGIIKIFVLAFYPLFSKAQIESVFVETYYISNADDATDTVGGHLEEESTTYRIFIDLLPGSRILSIYGTENHPLVFSGTAPFFNHLEEGITFGKDLNRNRYEIGTAALDSYITIGQCSKSFAQGAYFGVSKDKDQDGSIVGGVNNDGGSQEIESGLLTNITEQMGIPLIHADGMVIKDEIPDSWIDIGFKDLITDSDTTIFGLNSLKTRFYNTNALLRNSGVAGVDTVQNQILVAQLTTKGEIAFEINLELEILKEGIYQTFKYVARNEALEPNEIFSPLLKYPYTCGCKDPDYVEASTLFACTDNSKCITPIVFGCIDSLACNYNPEANFDLPDLCCYVGYCHDLDIAVVCPDLHPRMYIDPDQIKLYPNPVSSDLNLDLPFVYSQDISYFIYDIYGRRVQKGIMTGKEKYISVSTLLPGYYSIQLFIREELIALPFVRM